MKIGFCTTIKFYAILNRLYGKCNGYVTVCICIMVDNIVFISPSKRSHIWTVHLEEWNTSYIHPPFHPFSLNILKQLMRRHNSYFKVQNQVWQVVCNMSIVNTNVLFNSQTSTLLIQYNGLLLLLLRKLSQDYFLACIISNPNANATECHRITPEASFPTMNLTELKLLCLKVLFG